MSTKKPKFNFRTHVWPKYVLSAGLIVAATAASLGALFAYSNNSDEKKGKVNPTGNDKLYNVFVKDLKEAKATFLNASKNKEVAQYDFENDVVKIDKQEFNVRDYLNYYFRQNGNLPILNIRYGSFNFYNEYIEAVNPAEFFKFTNWFMTNVSWGPEIITLNSFSIVKGVEMKGNSITLGAHANNNKETTTITFYPDAFFGSLPIYSTLSGEGNAQDSLVYKINQNLLTYDQTEGFLSKISQYNALANVSSKTLSMYFFRNILDIRQLIGRKVYALRKTNWQENLLNVAVNDIEKARLTIENPYLLLINGANLEEAKLNLTKLINQYQNDDTYELLKNIDVNNLEEKEIIYTTINPNEALNKDEILDRYLNLTFDDGTEFRLFKSFKDVEYKTGSSSINFAIKSEENVESIKNGFKKAQDRIFALKETYKDSIEKVAKKYDILVNLSEIKTLNAKLQKAKATNNNDEVNQLKTQLNEQLANLNNDQDKINDILNLIADEYDFDNNSLVVNLDQNETLNYSQQIALANQYNELYHTYYNKLQTITSPILDGVTFSASEYEPYVYYVNDLAYLPNQLITIDSLVQESINAQLSWRDFYNINGFLSSKADELTDTTSKQFYLYAPELKSLEDEFNAKNPNSPFKFEFSKLQTELKELQKQSQTIAEQKSEHENIAVGSSEEGEKSIVQLMTPLFEADLNLPENYQPLGYNDFAVKKSFTFSYLASHSYEVLQNYLNLLTDGNPSAKDEKTKAGFNAYFARVAQPVLDRYANQINELKELEAQRDIYRTRLASSENDMEASVNLAYYQAQITAKRNAFNQEAQTNNLASYEQIKKLINFKEAIETSKTLIAKMISQRDEYINKSVQSFLISMDVRLINFKLNFLLNSPSFTDQNILDKYNQVLVEYAKERATLAEKFKTQVASLELEWFKARAQAALYQIQYSDYNAAFTDTKGVQDYQDDKNVQQNTINQLQTEVDELKTALGTPLTALKDLYEQVQIDSTNANEYAKAAQAEILSSIDETENKYVEYLNTTREKINNLVNEILPLKEQYESTQDEQEKVNLVQTIARKTTEYRLLELGLAGAEGLKNLFAINIKEQYNNLTTEINDSISNYEDLITLNNRISSLLSAFLSTNEELDENLKNLINEFNQLLETKNSALTTALNANNEYSSKRADYLRAKIRFNSKNTQLTTAKNTLNTIENNLADIQHLLTDGSQSKTDYETYHSLSAKETQLFREQVAKRKELTIIDASEPENGESIHAVDNLRFELNQLINSFYKNNPIISQFNGYLNELSDETSELNTLKNNYETKKNEIDFDTALNNFNQEVRELENYTSQFVTNLKQKAIIEVIQEINGENPDYLAQLVETANIENEDYQDAVNSKIAQYTQNLDSSLNKINQKLETTLTFASKLNTTVSELDSKFSDLETQLTAYLNKLKEIYKEAVLKSFKYLTKDDLENENRHEEILKLGIKIFNLNNKIYSLTLLQKQVSEYKTKFTNVSEYVQNLQNSAEISSKLATYKTNLKAYFIDESVKVNNAKDILAILFNNDIVAEFDAQEAQAEAAYAEIEAANERIEEIENEEGYEENEELMNELGTLRAKVANLNPIIDNYYALETLKDTFEQVNSEFGQAMALEESDEEPNNALANEKLTQVIESQEQYENSLDLISQYMTEYKAYAEALTSKYNYPTELASLYIEAIELSANNIIKITNENLLKESKQASLNDENNYGIELSTANQLITAQTKVELINKLIKQGILAKDASLEEVNKVVKKMELTTIEKQNTKLIVTLRELRDSSEKSFDGAYSQNYFKFNVDAKDEDQNKIKAVENLFKFLGYKRVIMPSIIKEEGNIKDPISNQLIKGYSVYTEAYQGLLSTLLKEVPYAAEKIEGEHLVSKINDQGVVEYAIENGTYWGFKTDSRIGLWAILQMSDPQNFKGVPTDFLKFVAAHEYGHHFTLNSASDLGNKGDDSIFIGALLPSASPNINNYYNKKDLELYLKARANIDVNADRLFDGNFVSNDFGEYPAFKLPKLVDGELTYVDEKEENIWGTPLYEDNVIKAIDNKKRRFLQTIEGLKEAAKLIREENGLNEKQFKASDLWIMNSLDQFSGTINPTVASGIAKYLVKEADGSYSFMPGSLEILKGQIKDGQGNLIEFETNASGKVVPKVVEGKKDANGRYISISKVLIKNSDGTGVINLPLDVEFGNPNSPLYDVNAKTYVNNEIQKVVDTISGLIVEKFHLNGWNDTSTDLSIDSKIVLDWPEKGLYFMSGVENYNAKANAYYRDMILARNPETGLPTDANNPFNAIRVYNNDGTLNVSKTLRFRNINIRTSNLYINPTIYTQESEFQRGMYALSRGGSNFGAPLNSGNGYVLFLDKEHQYIPNIKLEGATSSIIKADSWSKDTLDALGIKQYLKSLDEIQRLLMGLGDNALWKTYDENDNLLAKDDNVAGQYPVWDQTAKLKINLRALNSNFNNDLYNLFGNQTNGFGGQLSFSNFAEFAEFVSVDLKKATLDKANQQVNWNVEYVKTKVQDFTAFQNALKSAVEKSQSLSDEERTKYLTIATTDDEQIVANEIMTRFTQSKLAMFTSHITIQDVIDNPDYAWIFDTNYGYGDYKIDGLNLIKPNKDKWEFDLETYLEGFKAMAKEFTTTIGEQTYSPTMQHFSMYDALLSTGKYQSYTTYNQFALLVDQEYSFGSIYSFIVSAKFKAGKPSEDVISYYGSKNDRRFNEKFSDYTFNWAEIINRDNLQITYSPSLTQFGNLPTYLSNLSEANTGLEYVVDGTSTQKWKDNAIHYDDGDSRGSIKKTINDYELNYNQEAKEKARNLGIKYQDVIFANTNDFNDAYNYSNNYFGEFRSINNGWLKDRWYREILDFELYDNKGKAIEDETIRITNLKGERVTNRPEAFWQFYIQSQGVGKRELSTIWRDVHKDAVALFGYVPSDVAENINYLAFKDLETGEIKTVKINKDFTNNMFYYKEQRLDNEAKSEEYLKTKEGENPRHTLSDEEYNYTDGLGQHHEGKGFVAWVTDYAVMNKYRNKLLSPNNKYYVYFATNEQGNFAKDIDLGDVESVSENGKTFSQAPTKIYKADNVEFGGKYNNKPILIVKNQFNS